MSVLLLVAVRVNMESNQSLRSILHKIASDYLIPFPLQFVVQSQTPDLEHHHQVKVHRQHHTRSKSRGSRSGTEGVKSCTASISPDLWWQPVNPHHSCSENRPIPQTHQSVTARRHAASHTESQPKASQRHPFGCSSRDAHAAGLNSKGPGRLLPVRDARDLLPVWHHRRCVSTAPNSRICTYRHHHHHRRHLTLDIGPGASNRR